MSSMNTWWFFFVMMALPSWSGSSCSVFEDGDLFAAIESAYNNNNFCLELSGGGTLTLDSFAFDFDTPFEVKSAGEVVEIQVLGGALIDISGSLTLHQLEFQSGSMSTISSADNLNATGCTFRGVRLISSGVLVLNDCSVRSVAVPTLFGGCISLTGGVANVSSTLIFDCSGKEGGGIGVGGAVTQVSLLSVEIEDCFASDGGALYAGGVGGPVVSLNDCTLRRNTASRYGGGIHVDSSGTLNLFSTNVTANVADVEGGGLYVTGSIYLVMSGGSIVSANTAVRGGGIFYKASNAPSFDSVSFQGNIASDDGGGLYVTEPVSVTVDSGVVFSGNSAGVAGCGLFITGGCDLTVTGAGVITNAMCSTALGGGVYAAGSSTTVTIMTTTFGYGVRANVALQGGGLYVTSGAVVTLNEGAVVSGNVALDNAMEGGGGGGGLSVTGSNSAVYMNDGTVELSDATLGGAFFVSGSSALHVTKGTLLSNVATMGGAVYLTGSGSVAAMGGGGLFDLVTVQSNSARSRGGGLYVSDSAELTLGAGLLVTANTASETGGGLYVTSSAAFITVTSGITISFNGAAVAGGGVYLSGGARLSIDGAGSIVDNSASSLSGACGGGIYASGTDTSVSISVTSESSGVNLNSAGLGGGLYVASGASVTLDNGGVVTANVASEKGGGIYVTDEGSLVTLDGGARVLENMAVDGGGIYVTAAAGLLLSDTAAVTKNAAAGSGGGLYLASTVPVVVGGSVVVGQNTALVAGCGIYLCNGTSLTVRDSGSVRGHVCEGAWGGGIYAADAGTSVTILNTNPGAGVTGNTAKSGGGLYVTAGANATMADFGELYANTAVGAMDTQGGGGVFVSGEGSTLTLAAGGGSSASLTQNTANYGGGIFVVDGATLWVSSGASVSSNSAVTSGGGVLCDAEATVTLVSNGLIAANTAQLYGGGLSLGGGCVLAVSDESSISGNVVDPSYLGSGSGGGGIYASGAGTAVTVSALNGVTGNSVSSGHGGGIFVVGSGSPGSTTVLVLSENGITHNSAANGFRGGGIYASGLLSPVVVTVAASCGLAYNSGGHGGGLYIEGEHASVTIVAGSSVAFNNATTTGGGVHVAFGADATAVPGGLVTNNTVSAGDGGGFYVEGEDSHVAVMGGSVRFNTASNGGGLYVASSATVALTFNALVSQNTATNDGGGLHVSVSGTLTLATDACSVSANRALGGNGGGLYLANGCDLIVQGFGSAVVVSSNTAGGEGGGVYASGLSTTITITATNGISLNTAASGGGVSLSNFASLALYGGAVNINNATSGCGGGVLAGPATSVTLGGFGFGYVSSNHASVCGGGLFVASAATLTLGATAVVQYNTALESGGGLYVEGTSTVTVPAGAIITANWAGLYGAGVYLTGGEGDAALLIVSGSWSIMSNNAPFVIGGGVCASGVGASVVVSAHQGIYMNNALAGGGVALYNGSIATVLSSGSVADNTAVAEGGGVYLASGNHEDVTSPPTLTLSGGSVIGNKAEKGGGIYGGLSTALVLNSGAKVENNHASVAGGGLYLRTSLPVIVGNETAVSFNSADLYGSGIFLKDSAALVVNGTGRVSQNGGQVVSGGGVFAEGSSSIVVELTATALDGISRNTAVDTGGGISLTQASSCTVRSGGRVASNTAAYGGGIWAYGPSASLFLTSGGGVSSNSATSAGGGLALEHNATLSVGSAATIAFNTADVGGGAYLSLTTAVIGPGCLVVTANSATSEGGGLSLLSSSLTVSGCGRVSSNTAGGSSPAATCVGGGVAAEGSSTVAVVAPDGLSANKADKGGGLYLASGSVLTASGQGSITANEAFTDGGGVYAVGPSASIILDDGGRVANNSAGTHGGGLFLSSQSSLTVAGGGSVSNNSCSLHGGGVFVTDLGSTLSIQTALGLASNTAHSGGGVYATDAAAVSVTQSGSIAYNVAVGDGSECGGGGSGGGGCGGGGGVYGAELSSILLSGTTVQVFSNVATGGCGGGLFILGSLTLESTAEVSSNTAALNGGGVYSSGPSALLSLTQLAQARNNSALRGGAFYLANSTALSTSLENAVVIAFNDATESGGAIHVEGAFFSTSSGTLIHHNNVWAGDGAAIYSNQSTVSLASTLLSDNSGSGHGGAIFFSSSGVSRAPLTLSNVTIEYNFAAGDGGGLYLLGDPNLMCSATFVMRNTADVCGGGLAFVSDLTLPAVTAGALPLLSLNVAANGGGLCLRDWLSSFTFDVSSNFSFNTASKAGGSVYVFNSNVVVSTPGRALHMSYNHAYRGAGMALVQGSSFSGEAFSTLLMEDNLGTYGGGLAIMSSSSLSGVKIESTRNRAAYGGVFCVGCTTEGTAVEDAMVSIHPAASPPPPGGERSWMVFRPSALQVLENSNYGGGMAAVSGAVNVLVRDSVFEGGVTNEGSGGGLSVFSISGSLEVYDSNFTECYASFDGGGLSVFNISGSVEVYDTIFTLCSSGYDGGGLALVDIGGSVELNDNAFVSCHSESQGGGLLLSGDFTVSLSNSSFSACVSQHFGGGLLSHVTHAHVEHTVFSSCHSVPDGGSLYVKSGAVVVESSHFVGNTGGAVRTTSGDVLLSNVFMANNVYSFWASCFTGELGDFAMINSTCDVGPRTGTSTDKGAVYLRDMKSVVVSSSVFLLSEPSQASPMLSFVQMTIVETGLFLVVDSVVNASTAASSSVLTSDIQSFTSPLIAVRNLTVWSGGVVVAAKGGNYSVTNVTAHSVCGIVDVKESSFPTAIALEHVHVTASVFVGSALSVAFSSGSLALTVSGLHVRGCVAGLYHPLLYKAAGHASTHSVVLDGLDVVATNASFMVLVNGSSTLMVSSSVLSFEGSSVEYDDPVVWVTASGSLLLSAVEFASPPTVSNVLYCNSFAAVSLTDVSLVFEDSRSESALAFNDGGSVHMARVNLGGLPSSTAAVSVDTLSVLVMESVEVEGLFEVLEATQLGNLSVSNMHFGTAGLADDPIHAVSLLECGNIELPSEFVFVNCTFEGLKSRASGPAIFANSREGTVASTLVLQHCAFVDNEGGGQGGAVRVTGLHVMMTMCVFSGNSAGVDGGALHVEVPAASSRSSTSAIPVTTVVLTVKGKEVVFVNNTSSKQGGSVVLPSSVSSEWEEVVFRGSVAGGEGGAWAVVGDCAGAESTHTFVGGSFVEAFATQGGAVFWSHCSRGTFVNTTFAGNRAQGLGGALSLIKGLVTIVNSTLTQNTALSGGAVHVLFDGTVEVVDSVLEYNSDGLVGLFSTGAIRVNGSVIAHNGGAAVDAILTRVELSSCVIADNSAAVSAAVYILLAPVPVVFSANFISNNTGTGFLCTGSQVVGTDGEATSVLCGNSGVNFDCRSCDYVVNGVNLCEESLAGVPPFERSCSAQCLSAPAVLVSDGESGMNPFSSLNPLASFSGSSFCVNDGSAFVGPYAGGCESCGGLCQTLRPCSPYAYCIDDPSSSPDGYECECGIGFVAVGNGTRAALLCADLNECSTTLALTCPSESICTNTLGSFFCDCGIGLEAVGEECVDVDECGEGGSSSCSEYPAGACSNTVGSFSCTCSADYYGNGTNCVACPGNSTVPPGSVFAASDCVCLSGHYRAAPWNDPYVEDWSLPCTVCGAGSRVSDETDLCISCPPGSYNSGVNVVAGSCPSCPLNSWSASGAKSVEECTCSEGYFLNVMNECQLSCPPGTFVAEGNPTSGGGQFVCVPCPPDTFSISVNASECTGCPPRATTGGVSGGNSSSVCTCPAGLVPVDPLTSDGLVGPSGCEVYCPPGTWELNGGCPPCPRGFYSNTSNVAACTRCPPHSSTLTESSTSVTACVCDEFFSGLVDGVGACELICEPGEFVATETECALCPPNYFSVNVSQRACTPCPDNRVTGGDGANSPDDCECLAGFVPIDPTQAVASPCERYCGPGSYRTGTDDENGGGACVLCPLNTYSAAPNEPSCTLCPFNTVTLNINSSQATDCVCEAGFTLPPGAGPGSACELVCPAGTYLPSVETNECILCPSDTYGPTVGATACVACPPFSTTNGAPGGVTLEACACSEGYYRVELGGGGDDGDGGSAFTCESCPEGAFCEGGTEPPTAKPGYGPVGEGFEECRPAVACAGNGECSPGYTGELCAYCEVKHFRLDGRCEPCRSKPGLVIFLLYMVFFAFCAFLVLFNLQDRVVNRFASLMISVNSLQIMGLYGRLDLEWPALAEDFFSVLSFANLNIELVSPECAVASSSPFVLRWVLTLVLPLFTLLNMGVVYLLLLLWMAKGASSRAGALAARLLGESLNELTPRRAISVVQRAFAQLLVIAYLPLASTVLEFFACTRTAPERWIVASSPDMTCYDRRYWGLLPVALAGTLLYVVGIPAAYAAVLWFKRRQVGEAVFALDYGFLVGRYRPQLYFYELAILARKLLVVVMMTVVGGQASNRALATVLVLIVALLLNQYFQPYHTALYNAMEALCLMSAMIILVLTLMFDGVANDDGSKNTVIVLVILMNLLVLAVGVASDVRRLRAEEAAVESELELADRTIVDELVETKGLVAVVDLGTTATQERRRRQTGASDEDDDPLGTWDVVGGGAATQAAQETHAKEPSQGGPPALNDVGDLASWRGSSRSGGGGGSGATAPGAWAGVSTLSGGLGSGGAPPASGLVLEQRPEWWTVENDLQSVAGSPGAMTATTMEALRLAPLPSEAGLGAQV